jgi:hypothetical protein
MSLKSRIDVEEYVAYQNLKQDLIEESKKLVPEDRMTLKTLATLATLAKLGVALEGISNS